MATTEQELEEAKARIESLKEQRDTIRSQFDKQTEELWEAQDNLKKKDLELQEALRQVELWKSKAEALPPVEETHDQATKRTRIRRSQRA